MIMISRSEEGGGNYTSNGGYYKQICHVKCRQGNKKLTKEGRHGHKNEQATNPCGLITKLRAANLRAVLWDETLAYTICCWSLKCCLVVIN